MFSFILVAGSRRNVPGVFVYSSSALNGGGAGAGAGVKTFFHSQKINKKLFNNF